MIRFKQNVRLVTAAILGLFSMQLLHWVEGYWIVLSAIFVMFLQVDTTFLKSQGLLLCYGVLLACHVWIASYLSSYVIILAFYLFIITFLTLYFSFIYSDFFLPSLIMNCLGFLSAGMPTNDLLDTERIEAVLLGLVIALTVRSLICPDTTKDIWKRLCKESMCAIDKLQQRIFAIYLQRDYAENYYSYEINLHEKRFAILDALNRMRAFATRLSRKARSSYLEKANALNVLSEAVGSLGNLRYQVKDFTTFEVCESELQQVSKELSAAFNQMIGCKSVPEGSRYLEKLEEIFSSTLQVVSQEPMVLLIFINHIKNILSEIHRLAKKDICG